jgi:hypothetical protein
MYREQFLAYLDRYDKAEQSKTSIAPIAQPRRSLEGEWFRKPSTPARAASSSFSSWSQDSAEPGESTGSTRQDGEGYLSTPCVKQIEGFDILEWWANNEHAYPYLAQVAKDILAIPIAQVGVERVFNSARDVIGDRRHRLSAQTIRQIMMLKDTIFQETQGKLMPLQESTLPSLLQEQTLPQDEIDDLLELPADLQMEELSDGLGGKDTDEEPATTLDHENQRPARKRVRPARYRDK